MKLRGATTLAVVVLLVATAGALSAVERRGYHEKEFTMYGKAVVTFSVFDKAGKELEKLKLTSLIAVRMGVPYTNRDGLRQFDFWIEEWEVFGPSKTLDANFIITVSEGVKQPKSVCTALKKGADFPADVVFNSIYDVYLNDKPVLTKIRGRGVSKRATVIPPDTPTIIEHPFEIEGHPISKGACEAADQITAEQFKELVAKARALRGLK